jgi:hypothetical protein
MFSEAVLFKSSIEKRNGELNCDDAWLVPTMLNVSTNALHV